MASKTTPSRSGQPKQLSSTLLQMKFMRRKQEADVRKALEEQQQRVIDESHWVLPVSQQTVKVSLVQEDPSYVTCENLLVCGRRSYGSFNTEVEKLQREEEQARSEYYEMRETISDQEMASRYLSNTAQGQGQGPTAAYDAKKHFNRQQQQQYGGHKRQFPRDSTGGDDRYKKKAFIRPEK